MTQRGMATSIILQLAWMSVGLSVARAGDLQILPVRQAATPAMTRAVHMFQLSRWPSAEIRWQYNPIGQPENFTTEQILSTITAAMDKWQQGCKVKFSYQGLNTAAIDVENGVTSIGWVAAGRFPAYTTLWAIDQARLVEGDVVLDPRLITDVAQLETVLTHEVGHLLGLDHSDQPFSVMYANPYHPAAYGKTLKGDDGAACAHLYGSNGLTPYVDEGDRLVSVANLYLFSLFVDTLDPAVTRGVPQAPIDIIPSDYAGKIYFTAYYRNVPAGKTFKIRLVAPDGDEHAAWEWVTPDDKPAYRTIASDWQANPLRSRMPGTWALQVLAEQTLVAEKRFEVTNPNPVPAVPQQAMLVRYEADGSLKLTGRTINPQDALQTGWWVSENLPLGQGLTGVSVQPTALSNSLWLGTRSTHPRYTGQAILNSAAQGNGADHVLRLTVADGWIPQEPGFGADASGNRAAMFLSGQWQIPDSGVQQLYAVAKVDGEWVFKTSTNAWNSEPQSFLTAEGPGWVVADILTAYDARRLLAGSELWLGYGQSYQEALALQRFQRVFVMP